MVKLISESDAYLIANAIRYSHATWDKSDTQQTRQECITEAVLEDNSTKQCYNLIGEKDLQLIKKIGFHMNHESVLEHSLIVFDITMSTKALLEESRHRIGLSQTVTSSRYALDLVEILWERTGDPKIDSVLESHVKDIEELIAEYSDENNKLKKSDMDKIAMLLPQAFLYRLQLTFNLRSLRHFLQLRLAKSAHITIRSIAVGIMNELKNQNSIYFELLLEDKSINSNYYANYNTELRG